MSTGVAVGPGPTTIRLKDARPDSPHNSNDISTVNVGLPDKTRVTGSRVRARS